MKNFFLVTFLSSFINFLLIPNIILAQEGFPINGVTDNRENYYAFSNAKIFVDYKTVIENGTLIIKKGKIVSVGQNISIPKGVKVFDLKGKYVYPSFIDLYSEYGIIKDKRNNAPGNWMSSYTNPQMLSEKNGPFGWNESIRPEYNSVENFKFDSIYT